MNCRSRALCYVIALGLIGGSPIMAEDEPAEPEPLDPSQGEVAEPPETDQPAVASDMAERYGVSIEIIEGLRDDGMGFGEIEITLALAQRIEADGIVEKGEGLPTILAAREDGKGLGQIAQDHGLILGEVISDVRGEAPERPERPDRPDRPDRPERPDRPDTPDRPDRPDRPGRGPHQ